MYMYMYIYICIYSIDIYILCVYIYIYYVYIYIYEYYVYIYIIIYIYISAIISVINTYWYYIITCKFCRIEIACFLVPWFTWLVHIGYRFPTDDLQPNSQAKHSELPDLSKPLRGCGLGYVKRSQNTKGFTMWEMALA